MPKPKQNAPKPQQKKGSQRKQKRPPRQRRPQLIKDRVNTPVGRAMSMPLQSISKKLSDPITLGLSLPHLFPTPRFSDQFTSGPTAIANPFAVQSKNWSTPNTVYNAIPKGCYYAATSRSVLSNLVEWRNLESDDSVYDCYFPYNPSFQISGTNFDKSLLLPCPCILADMNEHIVQINPHYATSRFWGIPGYNSLHGFSYYQVDAGGRKGTWLEPGEVNGTYVTFGTSVVMPATNITANACSIRAYLWNGDSWTPVSSTAAFSPLTLNSTANFTPLVKGYYAFEAVVQITSSAVMNTTSFRMTMVMMHKGSGFGFSPMPHVEEMALNIDGLRSTAISIMLSPHPSVLNLGGEVAGVQLPPSESWNSIVEGEGSDPLNIISNMNGAYTGKLKDGIYGFLKPTSTEDFQMQEPFILYDEAITAYRNPVQPAGGWLVVTATVPATATNTFAGALAYLTLAHGVEYRTTNVWLSVQPPTSDPRVFSDAIYTLRSVTQWHENPWHIKDIFKSVMSAGKSALKLAPTIAELVSAFVPGVAPSKAILASLSALGHAL